MRLAHPSPDTVQEDSTWFESEAGSLPVGMLDQIRPALTPTAELRTRADGTEGVYDPVTGNSFETTRDQANLVTLFDGRRTVLEVTAEYLNRYGFVPFAALDDLIRGLGDAGLLDDRTVSQLGGALERGWFELLAPRSLARFRAVVPARLRAAELLVWPAAAIGINAAFEHRALIAFDVLLFYLGCVLALTLRDRLHAAVCALAGFAPRRTQLQLALGVVYLAPDPGVSVLMDRRQRIGGDLAALSGSACAVAMAWPWPGLFAGAFIVLIFDLCPMVRSSLSSMLTAFAGRVSLQDHVRAYVGLPMVARALKLQLPRADRVVFYSALLSMVWVVGFLWVVLFRGLGLAVDLIELGVQHTGLHTVLAYAGAGALFVMCPTPLLVLISHLIESGFALFWPAEGEGKVSRRVADLSVFRSIPLFSKLSDEHLASIVALSREVTYDAGQVIVEQGAAGNTFYTIRQGLVVVERPDAGGGRALARLGGGDCFGETAMLKDGRRTATVRALTRTTLIELASDAFETLVATVGGVDFASVLRAASAIGRSRLFKELPPDRVSSLATKFVPRSVPADTDVVRYGDHGDEFFLVAKGQVEVLDAYGSKLVTLGDGEVFGEIALLRNVPRTATVRTTVDTLLLVLSREVFLGALQADLSLSERVEAMAASRASSLSGIHSVPPPVASA